MKPAPAQTPKRSRRMRRAPTAPDKTPPPPPTPVPTRRQRRQPPPPSEPAPAPPVEPAPTPPRPEGPPVEPVPIGNVDGRADVRPRDIFDDDDPEATAAGAAPRPHVHFAGHHSDDGEYFPEPPLSTPSRSPSPIRQSSSQRRRHRQSPRVGPHAAPLPPPHRKGTDKSGSAKDVWTFFEPKEPQGTQKRECLFCKCMEDPIWKFPSKPVISTISRLS
ncbi:hypothetical protein B0H19DRAFT_1269301 [Mycena capillaripes]|nr:hypothetical protein B0H19DRAFT_1269301 [Mycena capillaripes]